MKKYLRKPKLQLSSLLALLMLGHHINTLAEPVNATATAPVASQQLIQPLNTNVPEYVIIKPSNEITFSSETTASVGRINFKEGQTFRAGDILLELDCRVQQAELKKALAQQQAANSARKSAEKLKAYGSISEVELIKARSDAQIANAEVDKLKAIVDKCTIKAPFNGSVAEVMVHPYETVKPSDPLLKITNTENLDFELQVPSTWLQWLHVNSEFKVHVNEIDKTIPVKVVRINPQIDPISQTVKIIGTNLAPDAALLPGMSGQANFPHNAAKSANTKDQNAH